ncbi:MAG TPA: hypothetical protein ENK48_00060 [Gammaproteobacteria bacterium]|nr:hypothetical protein [Gammaproteobacteria bacterium]
MERKHKRLLQAGAILGLVLPSQLLWAETWVDRTRVDGFFSTRYSITDEKTAWLGDHDSAGIDKDGSFYGTKLGLNISSNLSDRVTVATQLFSAIQDDSYVVHVDWAFATFQLNDTLALRTGKIKYPVGIVNEYVEVGVTYPWIQAPVVIYSEQMQGPQATRESYTGGSLLWDISAGDWAWTLDVFGGQVGLEMMDVRQMIGATGRANWDDTVIFQVSGYQGKMETDTSNPMMGPMNNQEHAAVVGGVKIDWNNWLVYSEVAKVTMDFEDMAGVAAGDSDSWYATLGYRFGKWLPHVTYQDWERKNGDGQQISTVGLNYNVSNQVVVKAEFSQVDTDGDGLFEDTPENDSMNMFSLAVDTVF